MATFSDVGKDVNDQLTKDLAKEQNVEVNSKLNDFISVQLKGNIKSGAVEASAIPTIKIADYGLEIKPELSTKDKNGKTLKVDVTSTDFVTKGLKIELGGSNGTKGDLYVGAVYKNSKFGGVTGKFTLPSEEGKDKFFSPSVYYVRPDVHNFGIGGTTKVVLGESASLESFKVLGTYKNDNLSAFFGFERKPEIPKKEEEPKTTDKSVNVEVAKKEEKNVEKNVEPVEPEDVIYLLGGFQKQLSAHRSIVASGSFNTNESAFALDVMLKKSYVDGTFFKLRGNLDGNVGVSRQFKPQTDVTLVLGANVDVFSGKGNAGFQINTTL